MEDAIGKPELNSSQTPSLPRGLSSLFSSKPHSAIIVDTSSNIKLICLGLKGTPKISALKISDFNSASPE